MQGQTWGLEVDAGRFQCPVRTFHALPWGLIIHYKEVHLRIDVSYVWVG